MKFIGLTVVTLIALLIGYFEIFAGGISGGGGTPPSVQLNNAKLQSLQKSALNGDLIRITKLGSDPVYLRPDLTSIKIHSFRANALPAGQETVFYTESPAEKIQTQMALSMARSMKTSVGSLPAMPSDFEVRPDIKIDTILESDLDEDAMN